MPETQTVAQWMEIREVDTAALVEASGLDRRVVEALIEGRYTPSPRQREQVAAALRVEPSQIAWGHTSSVDHMYGHGPQFGRSP